MCPWPGTQVSEPCAQARDPGEPCALMPVVSKLTVLPLLCDCSLTQWTASQFAELPPLVQVNLGGHRRPQLWTPFTALTRPPYMLHVTMLANGVAIHFCPPHVPQVTLADKCGVCSPGRSVDLIPGSQLEVQVTASSQVGWVQAGGVGGCVRLCPSGFPPAYRRYGQAPGCVLTQRP